MPKKKSSSSSLKKLSQQVEKPAIQQTKPVPKPGKLRIEIDEIFGERKKKKKPELVKTETKAEVAKEKSSSSSLKKLSQQVEKPAIQQTKPVPKPGKLGIEIDEIFGERTKKKKPELVKTETKAEVAKKEKSSSSSLKKLSQQVEKPAIQQTKPVPKPGKLGIEIDEIFGERKKKKKPEVVKPETKTEVAKKERKRKRNELDGFNNNPKTRPRKRTKDGLPVFTEDELGLNKAYAGGTPLCPFDCNCCF